MTRRDFLAVSALAGVADVGAQRVHVTVDANRKLGVIPADFLGLGYEISSVSTPGLLSAKNHIYTQLIRTLGPAGVIRVGGITADYASFRPSAQPVSSPKGSIVNLSNLRELASILKATGWKLIWCLNLGTGDAEQAVTEAQAVAAEVGSHLLALEIGNEPDLFNRGSSSHRASSYGYADYLQEYRRVKAAIRAKLPNVPFAGPDAATVTEWVTRFAADEGSDLKLLTHHYYRECAGPTSTLDKLLHPDPKLGPLLEKLNAATVASHVPYRFCETNSFCGGGKPGVSDTFGSALWVLDFLWRLAEGGCAGVNMETGVNQLDFVSSYSPIADNAAKPEYYGMLAFAHAAGGARVSVEVDAGGVNLAAYAVQLSDKLCVTIINKDESKAADVGIKINRAFETAKALRLSGPTLESKDGVTFGGSSVTVNGDWKARVLEPLESKGEVSGVHVPAASAVVVNFNE